MGEEFQQRCEELKDLALKGDVRAVVLTGNGRAFSAGGDLDWLVERSLAPPPENEKTMLAFYSRFLLPLRAIPVPTVAAINGPAIGAGMCVSLAADVRLTTPSATLGFTFVGLGLHPGMGSTHFLPSIAGPEVASRLLLSGEKVNGEEAAHLGIVSECVKDNGGGEDVGAQCVAAAVARAQMSASQGSPCAVQTLVTTLRQQQDVGLMKALQREAAAQALCYTTADYAEGLAALKARRSPIFVGK
jgi:enoyl-CoA hydratase/carnithine racemase